MDYIREKYPQLLSLYHEIYDHKDRSYWTALDKKIKSFADETGLDYVTNDDSMKRKLHSQSVERLSAVWLFL